MVKVKEVMLGNSSGRALGGKNCQQEECWVTNEHVLCFLSEVYHSWVDAGGYPSS